jgi:hypothetical protein
VSLFLCCVRCSGGVNHHVASRSISLTPGGSAPCWPETPTSLPEPLVVSDDSPVPSPVPGASVGSVLCGVAPRWRPVVDLLRALQQGAGAQEGDPAVDAGRLLGDALTAEASR